MVTLMSNQPAHWKTAAPDQALPFEYVNAETIEEAQEHLSADDAEVFAGGTDIYNEMKNRLKSPELVVNVKSIDELDGIETTDTGLEIGAVTTLSTIAENEHVRSDVPVLAQAAEAVASPQIRNQGTIGGNLAQDSRCWYYRQGFNCYRQNGATCYALSGNSRYHAIKDKSRCITVHPSDVAPALIALDASLEIAGSSGRRTIDVKDFFVKPQDEITRMHILDDDEILTKIIVPDGPSNQDFTKSAVRDSWDFPVVNVATAIGDSVRIAVNGVAPTPIRAREAERSLTPGSISSSEALGAAQQFAEATNPNEDTEYKVRLLTGVIHDSIMNAMEE